MLYAFFVGFALGCITAVGLSDVAAAFFDGDPVIVFLTESIIVTLQSKMEKEELRENMDFFLKVCYHIELAEAN